MPFERRDLSLDALVAGVCKAFWCCLVKLTQAHPLQLRLPLLLSVLLVQSS